MFMGKTKQDILNEIANFSKTYLPPHEPKGFIPVVYTIPYDDYTAEQLEEIVQVIELIEKSTTSCIGRAVVGLNLTTKPYRQWLGVALLPPQFKTQKVFITNLPFKPIFEEAG